MNIQHRAASWLSSQIMSHEACIARLAGVQNDAVNIESQNNELRRMRQDVEVWKYLLSLAEAA